MPVVEPKTKNRRKLPAKLRHCDLAVCEGICCSDGAFLLPEEEALIHETVAKFPEHFSLLPKKYIGDAVWGEHHGRKTSTRVYRYKSKPAHFADTRCSFTEKDGKCSRQTLAVAQGRHKWHYKPMGCWLFPLESNEKGLVAPPRTRREDPNNLGRAYPGFVTMTPCGSHSVKGKVWWIALKEEVSYYRQSVNPIASA